MLIVGEIGYLPVSANGANLFFQLVNAPQPSPAPTALIGFQFCHAPFATGFLPLGA